MLYWQDHQISSSVEGSSMATEDRDLFALQDIPQQEFLYCEAIKDFDDSCNVVFHVDDGFGFQHKNKAELKFQTDNRENRPEEPLYKKGDRFLVTRVDTEFGVEVWEAKDLHKNTVFLLPKCMTYCFFKSKNRYFIINE